MGNGGGNKQIFAFICARSKRGSARLCSGGIIISGIVLAVELKAMNQMYKTMKALLIVDLQNDFCPGGALEVPEGDSIVPTVNKLVEQFDTVIQTQDWHPAGHHSFASSHEGKEPNETVEMDYGTQVLWPDHCIQESTGAAFHPDLNTAKSQVIVRKGFRKQVDSYSAFYENDKKTPTGLAGYLRERGITDLYTVGLATDFCVKWSILDGITEGFQMYIVEDAVKGIDLNGSVEKTWQQIKQKGVHVVHSEELLKKEASRSWL